MVCNKCGSEAIELRRDARGLPMAYCKDCGAQIKKMNTGEVIDYYEKKLAKQGPKEDDGRSPCKYCTEKYIMVRGNERTRIVQIPLDVAYCPMCGRKLKASDKAY